MAAAGAGSRRTDGASAAQGSSVNRLRRGSATRTPDRHTRKADLPIEPECQPRGEPPYGNSAASPAARLGWADRAVFAALIRLLPTRLRAPGWSLPAPSCGGTAASSPAGGHTARAAKWPTRRLGLHPHSCPGMSRRCSAPPKVVFNLGECPTGARRLSTLMPGKALGDEGRHNRSYPRRLWS